MNTGPAPVPDNGRCAPPFRPILPPSQSSDNETSEPFHCEESKTPARLSTDHGSRLIARCLADASSRSPLGRRSVAVVGSGEPRSVLGNEISHRWFRSRPSHLYPLGTRERRSHPK